MKNHRKLTKDGVLKPDFMVDGLQVIDNNGRLGSVINLFTTRKLSLQFEIAWSDQSKSHTCSIATIRSPRPPRYNSWVLPLDVAYELGLVLLK